MRTALLILSLAAGATGLHAQGSPTDSATALYREATAALGRNDAERAGRLFESFRARFPESPYTSESYFWHAMALAQQDGGQAGSKARTEALRLLIERSLRFPSDAEHEEAVALQQQLVAERRGDDSRADTTSCVTDADEAALIDAIAHANESPAHAQGVLASILSRRSPCLVTLRRASVHVLASVRRPEAPATLRLVAASDPDTTVRASARVALTPPPDAAAPSSGLVELRARRDTLVRYLGDTAAAPVRYQSRDRKEVVTTFALDRALHLIVLDVQPDGRLDIRLPSDIKRDARTGAQPAGVFRIAPRRVSAMTVAMTDPQVIAAAEQRRQLAIERCEAQAAAQARQEERRRAAAQRGDTSAAARAARSAPSSSPETVALRCTQGAPPTAVGASMATTPSRKVDGPPAEGYQLLLASPVKLSRIELVARLGVLPATPVANGSVLAPLARTIFAGHPAPWSGVVVGW